MNTSIAELYDKFQALINSDSISFSEVLNLKNKIGVYLIYNELEELLYIGNTNKLHIRFGANLKHEKTHTLVRKLIKNQSFDNRYEVIDFLKNKCRMKIAICESKRQAEALEHLAIYILEPQLNK